GPASRREERARRLLRAVRAVDAIPAHRDGWRPAAAVAQVPALGAFGRGRSARLAARVRRQGPRRGLPPNPRLAPPGTSPQATLDAAAIGARFDGTEGKPRSSAPAAAEPAPQPSSPAALAIEAGDVESRYGLALLQARSGDLEGAIAALKAIPDASIAAAEK